MGWIVDMKKEACQCGCGHSFWVAMNDSGPFFLTPACQEVYMNALNYKAAEQRSNGEAECIVPSTSSQLLLSSGSSASDDNSETG